jgi:hypothetical protein
MNYPLTPETVVASAARLEELSRFHYHVMLAVRPEVRHPFCWINSCGPWAEDFWQDLRQLDVSEFGGFVPLFVPWNKLFVSHKLPAYLSLINYLFRQIDPRFLYVTVTQNPAGIESKQASDAALPPNIFVLSQGGQGHVPLLLWLIELFPFMQTPTVAERDAFFIGRVHGKAVRYTMQRTIAHSRFNISFSNGPHRTFPQWVSLFSTSKFVLCPRGYGRNSFRLTEALQLGLVPVYVWDDLVWLPYYDSLNWSSFAVVAHIDDINEALRQLAETPMSTVIAMRKKVRSLYWSHFNSVAMFGQIRLLLKRGFGVSDLRCARFLHYP